MLLDGLNTRLRKAKEIVSGFERAIEIIQSEEQIEKKIKEKWSFSAVWENIKLSSISLIESPKKEKRGRIKMFEKIITEHF